MPTRTTSLLTSPRLNITLYWLLLALALAACAVPSGSPTTLAVTIAVDNKSQTVQVPAGSTVQAALEKAGIKLGTLDRVDPPGSSLLSNLAAIKVIRVRETFEDKEIVIPYLQQIVRNESFPKDQEMLIQKGVNGLQQVTYRKVFEDGVEVSNTVFKTVIMTEGLPEIRMVGVQTPFSPNPISGRLAYLTSGNAWIMEETTGKRKPVVSTGDLDGYIFSLSPDGNWLLYTRKAAAEEKDTINGLWAVNVTEDAPIPVDLTVKNVVHYAGWVPGAILTVAYSTVEPRAAAPGWQANNDLQTLSFTASGAILLKKEIVKTNTGGIYGWWGSTFAWSPDGSRLAYARPDSVGIVNIEKGELKTLLDIMPLQTRSDWAWVPGLSWSPDQSILYSVDHAIMAGMNTPEESPLFDVTALLVDGGPSISLTPRSGMFAYPSVSPLFPGGRYLVAYLQAIFPDQSETSNYRLVLMDRDGSNRKKLFPPEGSAGMNPQQVVWSPPGSDGKSTWIALIYQGNLWLVDPGSDASMQITGDGSLSRIDWK